MKIEARYVGRAVPRSDALEKAIGATRYMSDLTFANMLWGRVLRAKYPHALIRSIDASAAEHHPGVVCVLTHKHVMGHNGYGIAVPDHPVLCWEKVRYVGDAVALVAAETEEIASAALELIRVEYELLPVVDDPEQALAPDAPKLHEKGNVLLRNELGKSDVLKGFAESEIIIEQDYETQMMDHAFLETEGGVGVYDEREGTITVYLGSQYAFRDQLQIARALNWEPKKIRVVGSPVGGAFGGKDEITLQIHLALLAYYAKRPVKIVLSREESFITHVKRHPMRLRFRVGATRDGSLKALDCRILADAGAYSSLSGPVLNLALEGAPGPYRIPHTHLLGISVHTNNLNSGAFRGFGTTQSCFAMEITLDMMAEQLGLDPIAFRLKNVMHKDDISGIDHKIFTSVGIEETLLAARSSKLWQDRKERKKQFAPPLHYGVGVASEMQALGLGQGIPDFAGVRIDLLEDGSFLLRQGCIEIGQGNLICFQQMAADCLECDIELIKITQGDTGLSPDSGSVTASKSIYLVGNATYLAARELRRKIEEFAAQHYGETLRYEKGKLVGENVNISLKDIARKAYDSNAAILGEGHFVHPTSDKSYGDGLPHCMYSFITQIVAVIVDAETGQVDVDEVLSVPDCGRAINVQGVEGQCEGGVVMGMSYALFENLMLEQGFPKNNDFSTYVLPTSLEAPREHRTVIVESFEATHPFGAKGVAEPPNVAICPAIVNAIYDAIGVRFLSIPITPERIIAALQSKKQKQWWAHPKSER
jgi:CO/xanthine dehydrogenase Mo-binding subunit